MKSIDILREFVRESLSGSQPDESYSEELLDDPSFHEKSMLVPDDIKGKIRKWAKDMKLST
ncbi:hypothetical protein EBZ37_15245 [bacterium]|nr:hypothetical protein [bacterium]